MMNRESFLNLPHTEIAQLVKPKVCVFPINGTRRWFILEHPKAASKNFVDEYLRIGGLRHIELYRLFFDHGIDTLLTPVFGPELLHRGDEYMQLAAQGLVWFAKAPEFLKFYDRYQVKVRVYGDAKRYFQDTPYTYVLDAFEKLSKRTAGHKRFRLFFGVCAHDPTETVAQIGAQFYREHHALPTRKQIVELYYGEYVKPVDLFVGFDRPSAFDMPLLATGEEDLYFSVAPSPYLDTKMLRAILYDHLFSRRLDDAAYDELSDENWDVLASFYKLNRSHVLGLGKRHKSGAFWYPMPQVVLPPELLSENKP